MTMEIATLPDKISDLLDVAIDDCEAYDKLVEEQPERFAWDMRAWVEDKDGRCCVCMAGAMVRRCGMPPIDRYTNIGKRFGEDLWEKMKAIDYMRIGFLPHRFSTPSERYDFRSRFYELAAEHSSFYCANDRLPWPAYRELATKLREMGL